jgi:hypothetical protein
LLTRRAAIEPGALAWHPMPTSASLDSPISAAFTIASGLAEYVYRDPAAASTPSRSVTTAGSQSHGRSSESFDVQTPSMSPFSRPQASSAETTPPSCPCIRISGSAARASTMSW